MPEKSLDQYLADLNSIAQKHDSGCVGTVSKSGAFVSLFSYEVTSAGQSVRISPTASGTAFFKRGIFPTDAQAKIEVTPENEQLLKTLFGVRTSGPGGNGGDQRLNLSDLLDGAKRGGAFIIASDEEEARTRLRKAVRIPSSMIHEYDSLATSIFEKEGIALTKRVTASYIKSGSTLSPVVIKRAVAGSQGQGGDDRLMLALEYASLKGMRAAGLDSVECDLVSSQSGELALVMSDFAGRPFPVKEVDGGLVTSGAHFYRRPVFHSANTLLLRRNIPCSSTNTSDFGSLVAAGALGDKSSKLTEYAFNTMIGNTDMHGENSGVLREINEAGEVTTRSAPAFDVSPHLLTQPIGHGEADQFLKGKVLSTLGIEDVARSISHRALRAIYSGHQLAESVVHATVARQLMLEIVNGELCDRGIITKDEASRLSNYLSRPLGTSDSPLTLLQRQDSGIIKDNSYLLKEAAILKNQRDGKQVLGR